MGEVWCVTLWDARANLISKCGWTNGNWLMLQLVTDAMNLSPPNPTGAIQVSAAPRTQAALDNRVFAQIALETIDPGESALAPWGLDNSLSHEIRRLVDLLFC